MKSLAMIGVTIVVALMTLYQWPRFNRTDKKEKAVFAVLTVFGWIAALLLILFPHLPTLNKLVYIIYRPLGKYIED